MVEIGHRYQGFYPFGKSKQGQNTYLIVLKQNLSDLQLDSLKSKYKSLKDNLGDNFIKINRILKQQNSLHIIFEYYYDSVEMYLDRLKDKLHDKIDQELHKNIHTTFQTNIDDIIYTLVRLNIRTQILINNMACVQQNSGKDQYFGLKMFIQPESEYFLMGQLKNTENLQYFYFAQKKRLFMEFQELIEKKFGKQQHTNDKTNNPNFVINGTKLIFMKPQPKQIQIKGQAEIQRRVTQQQNKMTPLNFKQKFEKRIVEIKKVNAGIQQKHFNSKQPGIKTIPLPPLPPPPPQQSKEKIQLAQQAHYSNLHKGTKIINFDQSFQPQFKPEQFTKENTFLLEENEYLDQLQNQIFNLHNHKKPHAILPQSPKQQPIQKQHESNDNAKLKIQLQINKSTDHNKQLQKSNKSANNSNINNSNLSACSDKDKGASLNAVKVEKVNKYTMKITTSHQIQIQNGGEEQPNFQEIQKQILQNIRTGKINLSDLSNQKTNLVSKHTSPLQIKKQGQKGIIAETTKPKSSQAIKQIKQSQKVYLSNHQSNNNVKSINQMMQKIAKKNPIKRIESYHSDNDNQDNLIKQPYLQASQKTNEVECKPTVNIHANKSPNNTNKPEKIQISQEKQHDKPQNYMTKIREAKLKAQTVLKEYTKKKQSQ